MGTGFPNKMPNNAVHNNYRYYLVKHVEDFNFNSYRRNTVATSISRWSCIAYHT